MTATRTLSDIRYDALSLRESILNGEHPMAADPQIVNMVLDLAAMLDAHERRVWREAASDGASAAASADGGADGVQVVQHYWKAAPDCSAPAAQPEPVRDLAHEYYLLKQYGHHLPSCYSLSQPGAACTCGYAAALEETARGARAARQEVTP